MSGRDIIIHVLYCRRNYNVIEIIMSREEIIIIVEGIIMLSKL